MTTADATVRARIDKETKAKATDVLGDMGLTFSDAIRLFLIRVADDRRLPFAVKAPNKRTEKAIHELESGKGKRFDTVDALMADLDDEDD